MVAFKILASHTTSTTRAIMALLGLECSLEKELEFADSTELLGVVLDTRDACSGTIKVSNKPDRLKELADSVSSILESGYVECKNLPSLFGRALFVESQFWAVLVSWLCQN